MSFAWSNVLVLPRSIVTTQQYLSVGEVHTNKTEGFVAPLKLALGVTLAGADGVSGTAGGSRWAA
jgi:hypothetical protein